MKYKLFLDDYRNPFDCVGYMNRRIGRDSTKYIGEWVIVKDYNQFCDIITEKGLPELVSFDHDLANEHYLYDLATKDDWNDYYLTEHEMTGYDCAKWLIDYCMIHGKKLPKYFIHSMNPIGSENIKKLLDGSGLL